MFKGIEWDDVINIFELRQKLEKGEVFEVVINGKILVIVADDRIMFHKQYIENYLVYENMLFIKIKND